MLHPEVQTYKLTDATRNITIVHERETVSTYYTQVKKFTTGTTFCAENTRRNTPR